MSTLTEAISKFKNPFNVLAVASFALGISALFPIDPIRSIIFVLFGLSVFFLLLTATYKFIKWSEERSSIHFYPNWKVAPKKYLFPQTLDFIGKNRHHLDMIVRTGFRFLCGSEETFDSNPDEYKKQKKASQDNIVRAVERGGQIGIYLQGPSVIVPTFSVDDSKKLRRHQVEAINSYKEILERLSGEGKRRFRLYYVNTLVDNSMTRIFGDNKALRLLFDISVRFLSKDVLSKPFVVFEPGIYDFSEYLKEFKHIASEAEEMQEFDTEKKKAIKKLHTIVRQYNHHSPTRNDRSELIVPIAANSYLTGKTSPFAENMPPACIQVLVTNDCTTHCSMCDHYKLHKNDNLVTEDIKAILDSIKAIGTKNIIISGGEPLSRADIFEILEYAKHPFKENSPYLSTDTNIDDYTFSGLNIGLLTNGLKKNGDSLNEKECEILKETCSWVQVSIDGFDQETYKSIRGHDYLEGALETLTKLRNVGHKNLEICYTIQSSNIKELTEISFKQNAFPSDIPIRFKFAHGPTRGKDFLCTISDLKNFITQWSLNDSRFNYPYLTSMLSEQFFDYEGVSSGRPLKKKMEEFHLRKYKCKALDLTMKIDPKGDVYPCCFLFDDNNSDSRFRDKYFLGTLRGAADKIVPPKPSTGQNSLSKIWFNNKVLEDLRSKVLPVDLEACSYCTRHFYQNEYMNKAESLFRQFDKYGVAEYLLEESRNKKEQNVWV